MRLSKTSRQIHRTFRGSFTTIRCPRNSRVLPRAIRARRLRSHSHRGAWRARAAALTLPVATASATGRARPGMSCRATFRARLPMALHNLFELGHSATIIVLVERPTLTGSCDLVPLVRVGEVVRDQPRAVRRVLVSNDLLPRHEELC